MIKIKIIELLSKIANGEIGEHTEIEHQVGYNFGYYNIMEFFDNYIVDKQTLNMEVNLVDTPKKIGNLPYCEENTFKNIKECSYLTDEERRLLDSNFKSINEKSNEIIDYINKGE